MVRKRASLAVLVVVASALAAVAGEAPADPPDLAEALAGFKGFLVGDFLRTEGDGVVMLVRAVTLVEGSAAVNPAVLLGQETAIAFATETDDDGNERPRRALVRAVEHIRRMPPIHFRGLGGNAVVILGAPQQGAAAGQNVQVAVQHMTVRAHGIGMPLGGDAEPDGDDGEGKPKGPLLTARVLAGDDGRLVVDRLLPGSNTAHAWGAMPKLQFADDDEAVMGGEPAVRADELMAHAFKERGKALKAQMAALSKQLAMIRRRLEAGGELPEAQVAALRQQEAALQNRLDQAHKQIAVLKQQAEMRKRQAILRKRHKDIKKLHPDHRGPNDADF